MTPSRGIVDVNTHATVCRPKSSKSAIDPACCRAGEAAAKRRRILFTTPELRLLSVPSKCVAVRAGDGQRQRNCWSLLNIVGSVAHRRRERARPCQREHIRQISRHNRQQRRMVANVVVFDNSSKCSQPAIRRGRPEKFSSPRRRTSRPEQLSMPLGRRRQPSRLQRNNTRGIFIFRPSLTSSEKGACSIEQTSHPAARKVTIVAIVRQQPTSDGRCRRGGRRNRLLAQNTAQQLASLSSGF